MGRAEKGDLHLSDPSIRQYDVSFLQDYFTPDRAAMQGTSESFRFAPDAKRSPGFLPGIVFFTFQKS
jgi:hypothetical protein